MTMVINHPASANSVDAPRHRHHLGNRAAKPLAIKPEQPPSEARALWHVEHHGGTPYLTMHLGILDKVVAPAVANHLGGNYLLPDCRQPSAQVAAGAGIASRERLPVRAIALEGIGLFMYADRSPPPTDKDDGANAPSRPARPKPAIIRVRSAQVDPDSIAAGIVEKQLFADFNAAELADMRSADFLRTVRALQQKAAASPRNGDLPYETETLQRN